MLHLEFVAFNHEGFGVAEFGGAAAVFGPAGFIFIPAERPLLSEGNSTEQGLLSIHFGFAILQHHSSAITEPEAELFPHTAAAFLPSINEVKKSFNTFPFPFLVFFLLVLWLSPFPFLCFCYFETIYLCRKAGWI